MVPAEPAGDPHVNGHCPVMFPAARVAVRIRQASGFVAGQTAVVETAIVRGSGTTVNAPVVRLDRADALAGMLRDRTPPRSVTFLQVWRLNMLFAAGSWREVSAQSKFLGPCPVTA